MSVMMVLLCCGMRRGCIAPVRQQTVAAAQRRLPRGSWRRRRARANLHGMSDLANNFGPLLRQWRQRRRISQLDLALDGNLSARHLSFLETGRARPSREMVLRLAEQLAV